jgi:hypothetical protein
MSALRQALGGEAAPHTLEHNGRVYTVSLVTQTIKTQFSEWMWGRARRAAFSMREGMSEEQYERHLKALTDDYKAGEYDFESETCARVLKTKGGVVGLCSIVFGCSEDEMKALMLECSAEVKALLGLVMSESFPDMPKVEKNTANPQPPG